MGLNLKPLVASNPIRISELVGKVVAVDAFNVIYQFLATIRGPTGELLTNIQGEPTSHLSGLFYRNINLLCDGVKLVYIFDGKPHELKTKEIERRKKVKEEAFEKYNLALEEGRIDDAKKFSQGTSVLSSKMIEESKYLLSLMGIPYINAVSEGEATAALLSKKDLAYSSVSQDYDSILFGAKRLIRNLTISGKRKIPNRNVYVDIVPEIIEYDQVLKINNITHEQLIDIGILIGTDFNPNGFSGIGPKNALKLIQKFKKLEEIEKIKEELSNTPYNEIREIFLHPNVTDIEDLMFQFKDIEKERILKYLCDEKSFSIERVTNHIGRLEKSIIRKGESLDKWF
ncbi:MAG TPA: flap endonuclease-1 [Candidatus Nitrosocosmicus sp.]|nr:flap endonuclease-1 [Candidatus Nitrosocosmicus sp.]